MPRNRNSERPLWLQQTMSQFGSAQLFLFSLLSRCLFIVRISIALLSFLVINCTLFTFKHLGNCEWGSLGGWVCIRNLRLVRFSCLGKHLWQKRVGLSAPFPGLSSEKLSQNYRHGNWIVQLSFWDLTRANVKHWPVWGVKSARHLCHRPEKKQSYGLQPYGAVKHLVLAMIFRRGRTEKQTPKRASYGSLADRIFHADTSPHLEYWHLEYSKAGSIPSTRMEILLFLFISSVSNILDSRCRKTHVDRIRWKSWPGPSKQGFGMFWSSRKNTKIFQVQDCSSRYMLHDTA